jgi:hypothetical protein
MNIDNTINHGEDDGWDRKLVRIVMPQGGYVGCMQIKEVCGTGGHSGEWRKEEKRVVQFCKRREFVSVL